MAGRVVALLRKLDHGFQLLGYATTEHLAREWEQNEKDAKHDREKGTSEGTSKAQGTSEGQGPRKAACEGCTKGQGCTKARIDRHSGIGKDQASGSPDHTSHLGGPGRSDGE